MHLPGAAISNADVFARAAEYFANARRAIEPVVEQAGRTEMVDMVEHPQAIELFSQSLADVRAGADLVKQTNVYPEFAARGERSAYFLDLFRPKGINSMKAGDIHMLATDLEEMQHTYATLSTLREPEDALQQLLELLDKPLRSTTKSDGPKYRTLYDAAIAHDRTALPADAEHLIASLTRTAGDHGFVESAHLEQKLATLRAQIKIGSEDQALERLREIYRQPLNEINDHAVREVRAIVRHLPNEARPNHLTMLEQTPEQLRPFINEVTDVDDLDTEHYAVAVAKHLVSDEASALSWFNHIEAAEPTPWNTHLWSHIAEKFPENVLPTETLDDAARSLERHMAMAGPKQQTVPTMEWHIEELLARARGRAAEFPDDAIAADLMDEINTLGRKNLDRIAWNYSPDPGEEKGFSNFPDFGELGDMISSARFLDALSEAPAASPAPQAPRAVGW